MEKMTLKVAASSNPASVGGAVVRNIQEHKEVEVLAVGAGAVNQAVKGIAIAAGYAAPQGYALSTRIGFVDIEIEGEHKTAMKFKILVS